MYINNLTLFFYEMDREMKILRIMKKDGVNWVEAEKKQRQIKTLKEFI